MRPWSAPIVVTFLVTNFAPEAKGHGVPEVMDAIYYGGGAIRPVVAAVKSLASAIAIGSGATIGREGPIIQIGSAFGSTLGQILRMSSAERIILIACGGGGGIAATFNTPIGGVVFAIEILMPEVSARTFLPVAIATSTATFIGRYWFGAGAGVHHALPPAATRSTRARRWRSASIPLLGAIVGVAAAAFIRGLYFTEDLFEKIPGSYGGNYFRHMLGMLVVGAIIYGVHQGFGEYYIGGVGYATDQAILFGRLDRRRNPVPAFLLRAVATSITLGSGSSGGIFSPSLVYGRDARQRIRHLLKPAASAHGAEHPLLRGGRNGGDGGRRHRRGADRDHDAFRNDPRLRDRPADDPGGGGERRRAAASVARKHLYT